MTNLQLKPCMPEETVLENEISFETFLFSSRTVQLNSATHPLTNNAICIFCVLIAYPLLGRHSWPLDATREFIRNSVLN